MYIYIYIYRYMYLYIYIYIYIYIPTYKYKKCNYTNILCITCVKKQVQSNAQFRCNFNSDLYIRHPLFFLRRESELCSRNSESSKGIGCESKHVCFQSYSFWALYPCKRRSISWEIDSRAAKHFDIIIWIPMLYQKLKDYIYCPSRRWREATGVPLEATGSNRGQFPRTDSGPTA